MANIFTISGRFTGKLLNQPSVARVVHSVTHYISTEVQLSQIRMSLGMLKNKRNRHHIILGRTIYRLIRNNVAPFENPQVDTIIRVLNEIDLEIEAVKYELARRKAAMEEQKTKV